MHMLSFLSGKSEAQEFSFERYCRRIWARKAPGPVVPGRRHQPSLGRRMLHPSTGRFFAQEYRKGDTALRYRFRLPFEGWRQEPRTRILLGRATKPSWSE